MRVLVDARSAAFPQPTGIGRYTRALLGVLPQTDPDSSYIAWYLRGRDLLGFRPRPSIDGLGPVRTRWTPFPSRWFEIASERWAIPRVEWFARFDVLFGPNFVAPPSRADAVVVTVHDLAFRRFPETAPHTTRRWLARLEATLRRASTVIVPSHATRDALLELYAVEAGRTAIVPHGVDHQRFWPGARAGADAVARRHGIEGPYVLALGGLEPRKNLPRLLRAWASLPVSMRPRLVVAGGSVGWNPEGPAQVRRALAALSPAVRRDVVLTGYVADDDVAPLLAGAVALAYPSLSEGFGLPVLEAMACGTPVLSSNVSAIPEVAGDAAVLVDPRSWDAIADGLRPLIEDDVLRSQLRHAGTERAARFTWEEAARATAAVLHAAASRDARVARR